MDTFFAEIFPDNYSQKMVVMYYMFYHSANLTQIMDNIKGEIEEGEDREEIFFGELMF